MECTCLSHVNASLKKQDWNTVVESEPYGDQGLTRALVRVRKADEQNERSAVQITAEYCVFCGEKYPDAPDRETDGPHYVDDFRQVWETAREEAQRKNKPYFVHFDGTWYCFTLEDTDHSEAVLEVSPNGLTLPFDWDRLEAARETETPS